MFTGKRLDLYACEFVSVTVRYLRMTVKQSQPYPSILPLRNHYMTLYKGLLYIIFHFLVRNIGCEIDKAILDPL